MRHEVIEIRKDFTGIKLEQDFEPTLTSYCLDNSIEIDPLRKRPAVIVCPGGGYKFTSDREAEPVAMRFLSEGFNAFVLRYSVAPERYPASLLEAAASVALLRQRADEFNVDPNKIVLIGFSAGAHLSASLGAFWKEPFLCDQLGISSEFFRPNALILCYPVITSGEYAHAGSFEALLGEKPSLELKQKLSLESRITPEFPSCFIWHTFNDELVPVQNSLLLAHSLKKNGVPFELHIYPDGVHGMSLCNGETGSKEYINVHCQTWIPLCLKWLEYIFDPGYLSRTRDYAENLSFS
jgi:acetyl esterase/lipase